MAAQVQFAPFDHTGILSGPLALSDARHYARLFRNPANFSKVAGDRFEQQNAASVRGGLSDSNSIAVIPIRGVLTKPGSSFGDSMIDLRSRIRAAAESASVKRIMILIESPGGTVAGTHELAEEILTARQRKPVHAYIEDLGLCCGYWIAAAAGRVSINAMGQAGGIGVYFVLHDSSKQAKDRGVKVHVVKAGEFKVAGTPGAPIGDSLLAELQRTVDTMLSLFVADVARGRRISEATVRTLATGKVYLGAAAKALGLVDAVESFDDAMANLARV